MEKTFTLDQKETAFLALVEQDRTQALAMVGGLSIDMENARKNLDTALERQRAFVRQALAARGVERFENARVQNGAILVTMQEQFMPFALDPSGPVPAEKVNGAVTEIKE